MTTYKVIASDGRVVGRVDSREMADAIVEMNRNCARAGARMNSDRSNAAACAKLTYTVEVTK